MSERLIALLKGAARLTASAVSAARAFLSRWRDDGAYRASAYGVAAFACIFAFTVASLDYLITGGPDWNPGAPAIMQEAHAATIERVTQLNPPRIEALEVMATMTPAPLEEEVSFALLSADDLLGGPDDLFMASGMDALPPYVDYADESGKPLRAALITAAAPAPNALKHKPVIEDATPSETASLW